MTQLNDDLMVVVSQLCLTVMRLERKIERLDLSDSRHERRIDELVRIVEHKHT